MLLKYSIFIILILTNLNRFKGVKLLGSKRLTIVSVKIYSTYLKGFNFLISDRFEKNAGFGRISLIQYSSYDANIKQANIVNVSQ